MTTAEVLDLQGTQVVRLPAEFHIRGPRVSVRQVGEAVILEPMRPESWPPDFFDEISIGDPAFTRPDQGQTPPAPNWN